MKFPEAEARLNSADLAAVALMDETSIDWSSVTEATYLVHQHISYEYPGPIADLRHRLMIVPPESHGDQRRVAQRLDISPDLPARSHTDTFGNRVVTLSAPRVDRQLAFEHWALVERKAPPCEHRVPRALLEEPGLRAPSRLTAADLALREAGEALRAEHANPVALAEAINRFVFAHMTYVPDVTDVFTTAAAAFALGKGVCQDYAHVALALARECGMAARYVSGHLLGEGGTHAWIETIVPDGDDAVALAFDPTHDRRVSMNYVVIAVGRDYASVAPTSGVFTAEYNGVLSVRKRVGISDVRYAA